MTRYKMRGYSRYFSGQNQRRLATQASAISTMRPNREPTSALNPFVVTGSIGEPALYDQIEAGHPKIAKGVADLMVALACMSLEWKPVPNEKPAEARFRESLASLWAERTDADRDGGEVGIASVLQYLVWYWTRSRYIYEARWIEAPEVLGQPDAMFNGRRLELYPVHPSTVLMVRPESWESGGVKAIQQASTNGQASIPIEFLITGRRGGTPGAWDGDSVLRPLIFLFERWKNNWLAAERLARLIGGTLVLKMGKGESKKERERITGSLDDWSAERQSFLVVSNGKDGEETAVEYLAPTSHPTGFEQQIDRIDAYIDQALGRSVQSLTAAAHASRAMADVVEESDQTAESQELELLVGRFGHQVARWVADSLGYKYRLPELCFTEAPKGEETAAEFVATASAAKNAGLITWTAEDERKLRERLHMDVPPETTATADAEAAGLATTAGDSGAGSADAASAATPLQVGSLQVAMEIIRALKPTDPTVTPISQGAAIELLQGAGVPLVSAQAMVRAQLGMPAPAPVVDPATEPPAMSFPAKLIEEPTKTVAMSQKGDGVRMAAPKLITVTDITGQPVLVSKILEGPERFVAWSDTRRQRVVLDRRMESDLGAVVDLHREAVWKALENGWQAGEADAVMARYVPEYQEVVTGYVTALAGSVAQWTRDEARRQRDLADPQDQPATPSTLDDAAVIGQAASEILTRAEAGADIAAKEIAQRVQGEVERAWRAGADQSRWRTALKVAGLAAAAKAVGQQVESAGRIVAAADMIQTGEAADMKLKAARVYRTSVNDPRRCPVCDRAKNTVFELPRQLREWQAMPLPDPNCLGGADRCRCGWLIVWERTGA